MTSPCSACRVNTCSVSRYYLLSGRSGGPAGSICSACAFSQVFPLHPETLAAGDPQGHAEVSGGAGAPDNSEGGANSGFNLCVNHRDFFRMHILIQQV